MMCDPSRIYSMTYYDSVLIQTLQTIQNGEITLTLKRSYTYTSKYALIL